MFETSRPGNFKVEVGRDGRILSAIFDRSRAAVRAARSAVLSLDSLSRSVAVVEP